MVFWGQVITEPSGSAPCQDGGVVELRRGHRAGEPGPLLGLGGTLRGSEAPPLRLLPWRWGMLAARAGVGVVEGNGVGPGDAGTRALRGVFPSS